MSREIHGKRVLLLGYGREGQSAHRWLVGQRHDLSIGIADRSSVTPLDDIAAPDAFYCGERHLEHLLEFDTIIRSPGIPRSLPQLIAAERAGVHITSLTNIFFSTAPGKIVAVTGTKGKSTTSSLIYQILRKRFSDVRLVGNIGNPVLDYLTSATDETLFVMELSSFQLEDFSYHPQIAVLMRIVPEHLDHHGSFEAYRLAKLRIQQQQGAKDTLVLAEDTLDELHHLLKGSGRRVTFNTPSSSCWFDNEALYLSVEGSRQYLLSLSEFPLKGPGNLRNAMAAATVGVLMGVSTTDIADVLRSAKPLPHRLEYVGEFRSIRFYNDSLATIPQATLQALEGLEHVETLILGGHDRGVDLTPLVEGMMGLAKAPSVLVLLPTTGEKIWSLVCAHYPTAQSRMRAFSADSMEQAVRLAYQHTPPGSVCLLSPASSSLNLFRDYRDRGEQFCHWVQALASS
ncbi:MAG: UDP-N-acetylmuramoyl-L-alanine--D-glutamate ligase [Bdellovibrionales bacterium]|nr:UDP-N-acetylmuramoyl-L-alanine--D-glutamate ligase [Bdellovibrionales bacterium]